ncbi:hypothetical protein SAMN05518670_4131 [Paenibacillus sp. OK076]|nr:hypothetical protein SAMN05518670_4131 [Paenibacillus sp. OK076]
MSEHRINNFYVYIYSQSEQSKQPKILSTCGQVFGLFGYVMNYPQYSVYYFRAERNKNNGIRCLRRYVSSFTKC